MFGVGVLSLTFGFGLANRQSWRLSCPVISGGRMAGLSLQPRRRRRRTTATGPSVVLRPIAYWSVVGGRATRFTASKADQRDVLSDKPEGRESGRVLLFCLQIQYFNGFTTLVVSESCAALLRWIGCFPIRWIWHLHP